jgi:hypothetical protein
MKLRRAAAIIALLLIPVTIFFSRFCENKNIAADVGSNVRPSKADKNFQVGNTNGATSANSEGTKLFVTNAIDIFSANTVEQWQVIVKKLKKDYGVPYWTASLIGDGLFVDLNHKTRKISFEVAAISLYSINDASVKYSQIRSHALNSNDMRQLGLKLCEMFGLDQKKFTNWCNQVGDDSFSNRPYIDGDGIYAFEVRTSFNDDRPWNVTVRWENRLVNKQPD